MAFQHRPARRQRSTSLLPWRTAASQELAASLSMLAATLESTADGILVVDGAGQVVGRNEKFLWMWGLPDDVVVEQSLLDRVMDQVVDADAFRARVAQLYDEPELVASDEVELVDGRVFSRYTQPQRIDGRVVGRVWSFRDRTAERRLEQDLRRMAYHDELTGLANRALFMERGRELAGAAARTEGPLAVAVLDLDNLKDVNDRLGHQAGDELLVVTASRLCSAARVGDLVARLGGDEFGVLMPDAPPATAAAVLQRMSDAMTGPMSLTGRRVQSSISGGSSVRMGQVSLETLLHEADLAMYRAKSEGGGRVHAHDEEVSRADRRTGTVELEEVLADPGALLTVLQPICELTSGVLVGHESFTRFPGRGHREVGEWFALARDGGRGPALEARAVQQARSVHDPAAGSYLTVNVSPSVLGSPAVLEALEGDLSGVVVELTQDPGTDVSQLSQVLDRLHQQGARVAMADTGAGYDGLRRLVRVRPEIVKLDRELVHEVHDHPEKRASVEALVSFCRQTGAVLCAEGIETVEELRTLADLGVHLGQGWFIGRPTVGRPPVARAAAEACGAIGDTTPGDLDRLRAYLDRASTPLDVAQAARRSLAVLQADDLALSLLRDGELVMVQPLGWTTAEQRYVLADYPATQACLEDGVPLRIRTDDPDADRAEVRALREVGHGSVLLFPLHTDGRATGVVEVFSRAQRSWSDRELRVCRLMAEEVADALDRIERGAVDPAAEPAPPRLARPGQRPGSSTGSSSPTRSTLRW